MRLRRVGDEMVAVDDGGAAVIHDTPIEEKDFRGGEKPLTMAERRAMIAQLEAMIQRPKEEAYENFLRTQDSGEARAQAEGTGSSGGYIVPEVAAARFFENLKAADPLFTAGTTIETATGGQSVIPLDDDGAAAATQVSENQASVTTADVVFGGLAFAKTPTWRSGLIRCPNGLLQDSGLDLSGLLSAIFARRFARGCGAAFVTQLLSDSDTAVTSASPSAVTVDEVIDLTASLDSAYAQRGSFLMRFATYQAFLKQKGSTGGSYLVAPLVDSEGFPLLLGRRVYLSPGMPAIGADAKSVAYGDVSRFIIRRVRSGMTVRIFPERYAEFDQTTFEAYLRIQAALAKTAAGPMPVRILACHS